MFLSSQDNYGERVIQELLNNHPADLTIVTGNGNLSTSKLFVFNIFPQLYNYLHEYIISYHSIAIIIPDTSIEIVREAFKIMLTTGDSFDFEEVLGFNQTHHSERTSVSGNGQEPEEADLDVLRAGDLSVEIKTEITAGEEGNKINDKISSSMHSWGDKLRSNLLKEDSVKSAFLKKSKKLKCEECAKPFRDSHALNTHNVKFHRKIVNCRRCKQEFVGHPALKQHLKFCFNTCEKCNFITEYSSKMDAHRRRHAREEIKSPTFRERITLVYS